MRIPDEKIEELRAAADIVDVVGDYVHLKKSGSRFKGLCPFHDEKTPSFSVDPRQNLFYCFGCQKGGDLFTFVQEMEGVTFAEAARMLAERTGIPLPLPDSPSEDATEVEAIYHALRFAARFFYRRLTKAEEGRRALDYLRGRGFTPQTIKQFGLGYAPDAWEALLKAAEEASLAPEVLEKAGLVVPRKSGEGYYDRYRGRVIFPLFSHVGKVLGFAGRILDAESDQPKYINSPETRVYHKSRVLYGLFQAKQAIRRREEVLLVEGYTDVISLHQAGIQHAVASSGTALSRGQVKVLRRYAKRVVLLYDSDSAGIEAAKKGIDSTFENWTFYGHDENEFAKLRSRSIDVAMNEGLTAYVVELPQNEDPDSFVQKHGADEFNDYAEKNRKDIISFRYELAEREGALDTPEGRVEAIHSIVGTIASFPSKLIQDVYVRRASDVLGIPDIHLFEILGRLRREKQDSEVRQERQRAARPALPDETPDEGAQEGGRQEQAPPAPQPLPPERMLLRLMLEHGAPMIEFILGNMALDEFTEGPARQMAGTLLEMYEQEQVEPQRILSGACGTEVQNLAASAMVDEYEPSENWKARKNIAVPRLNEAPYEAAASAMTILKRERVNAAIERVKAQQFQVKDEGEALRAIQEQLIRLQALRRKVERREFLEWNA